MIDAKDLVTRVKESYVIDARNHRVETFSDRDGRYQKYDALVQGKWEVVFPGETVKWDYPNVQNTVQVALNDIRKLVTESRPAVRCEPEGDSDTDATKAQVRESIAETQWVRNRGYQLDALWAMDLAGLGAAYSLTLKDGGPDTHARVMRLDPRTCYPDIYNGQLLDLACVSRVKLRMAAKLYPSLGLDTIKPTDAAEADIIDYYGPDQALRVIYVSSGSGKNKKTLRGEIVDEWIHDLGVTLVGFAQLPSFDGIMRGMFDQVPGSLRARNRIVQFILDGADRSVYAQPVEKGLINVDDVDTQQVLHLDPNVPDARIERLATNRPDPTLFAMLQFLDIEEHSGIGYPASRQGNISQSQAAASFVAQTQGALSSTVKEIDALLGALREDTHDNAFRVEEKYLDTEKSLIRPVDGKTKYLPSKDIGENYRVSVIYGASAGLDRLNGETSTYMALGNGIVSHSTARNQIGWLTDPTGEQDRIEEEATRSAFLQKLLAVAAPDELADLMVYQAEGDSLVEAVKKLRAQNRLQAPPAPGQQPGQPGTPPPTGPPGPEQAQMQQLALEKGGIPGNTPNLPVQSVVPAPPLSNILVRNPSR